MQRYTFYLYLKTVLHVSGGTSTHHQERIQLSTAYICHTVTAICRYRGRVGTGLSVLWVAYAPDNGWKYHPKYVEQFPDMNKLCNVAYCWIYWNILTMHGPINVKSPNNTSKWQIGLNSAFKRLIIIIII
jgi:hypothetical protein